MPGSLIDWRTAVLCIAAYLIGGLPFGWIIARLRGIDIRQHGSGNIGATNIGRVLGKGWGLTVFLLDSGKCFFVMRMAHFVAAQLNLPDPGQQTSWLLLVAGALAIIGSVIPIWLGFRGGKAVSAAVGTMLGCALEPALAGVFCFAVWILVVKASGYVSLGSITAALLHPITLFAVYLLRGLPLEAVYPLLLLSLSMTTLILIRHRPNIARLRAGTEKSFRKPSTPTAQ